MNFASQIQLQCRGRFKQQPSWPRPSFVSNAQWKELVRQAWHHCAQFDDMRKLAGLTSSAIDVNQEWKAFMSVLSQVFLQATREAAKFVSKPEHDQELSRQLHQPGIRQGKGIHDPVVQQVHRVLRTNAAPNSSQQGKELSKKLARLYSLVRILKADIHRDKNLLCDCRQEALTLAPRLWPQRRNPESTAVGQLLQTSLTEIQALKDERVRMEDANAQLRFQKWKEKFSSADLPLVSQWVKQKESCQQVVTVKHAGQLARSDNEAAQFVHTYWTELWEKQAEEKNRRGVTVQSTADTLLRHFPNACFATHWNPPTLEEVAAAVNKCSGAGGCDSWTAAEVRALPEEALRVFYSLVLRWYESETILEALTRGRMVSLPKPHKIQADSTIAAADLPPITVLSIWWRIWAASWCLSQQAQAWAASLPSFLCGLRAHMGSEEATATLQEALVRTQGHLVTLDYSACYDKMCAVASARFLQGIGFPRQLAAHIEQAWCTQRWLQYGDHVHQDTITASAVPQGCPLAPLTLACWMLAGKQAVQESLLNRG
eukprot:Skav213942  [mRNA]  locus=scaffold2679:339611:341242:- [translate_table: standard]